jgi:hypothetical protein
MRIYRFTAIAWMLAWAGSCMAEDNSWFADIERYTSLREIRLDVAGPEPASFTAMGVAPFVTGQALASADVAFSFAQVVNNNGNPRAAFGVDFAATLLTDSEVTLGDYQHSHSQRVASRLQLSVAVSKGESSKDRSTRVAPTLRIVIHEQRDPRVHRGAGSLQDCFERHATAPESQLRQQTALAEQLKEAEALLQNPTLGNADRAAARQHRDDLRAQWDAGQVQYRAALQETVRQGMKSCRDDSEVAAYTWNATGLAVGVSPSFRNNINSLGSIKPKGLVVYATGAFGFDNLGTLPTYHPSFLGAHAQVLVQVLYRLNEPLLDPLQSRTFSDANELVESLRLRVGTSPWNGNIEIAEIRDRFKGQRSDRLTKLSVGMDVHLFKGTWLSLSAGRTIWREAIPNETSAGLSIKWTKLD